MSLFEEIRDTAKAAIDMTGDKAEEIIEKGKTKLKIYKLRQKLKDSYAYLGLRVYIKNKRGEALENAFEMQLKEIDAIRQELSELKEQADLIKYYEKCKNCGAFNDKEDEFCLSCGSSLKPFHKTVYSVKFQEDEKDK
ncbi:MAG: zinc ribbon domain-containing protein [Oscillospiraceae bacterium]|nr:zinc ribbon domain-containing protein [Oscillospiraceae bacterium]